MRGGGNGVKQGKPEVPGKQYTQPAQPPISVIKGARKAGKMGPVTTGQINFTEESTKSKNRIYQIFNMKEGPPEEGPGHTTKYNQLARVNNFTGQDQGQGQSNDNIKVKKRISFATDQPQEQPEKPAQQVHLRKSVRSSVQSTQSPQTKLWGVNLKSSANTQRQTQQTNLIAQRIKNMETESKRQHKHGNVVNYGSWLVSNE